MSHFLASLLVGAAASVGTAVLVGKFIAFGMGTDRRSS